TKKGQVGGPDRCGRPRPARRWWGDRLLHLHKPRPHAPGASNGLYRRAGDGQEARPEGGGVVKSPGAGAGPGEGPGGKPEGVGGGAGQAGGQEHEARHGVSGAANGLCGRAGHGQEARPEGRGAVQVLEETYARARTLETGQKVVEQQKSALEARSANLETSLQRLQTAYAAEQDTTKKVTQKAEELSKALELANLRLKAREEKAPDLAVLNYALGTNYSKVGMNEEARNAFQTALKFDPNFAEAHFELGRLYLGHFDDKRSAVPHLRRYLQLKPAAAESERVSLRCVGTMDIEARKGYVIVGYDASKVSIPQILQTVANQKGKDWFCTAQLASGQR